MTALLELDEVQIGYRSTGPLVPPLSLMVDSGSFVGVVGPNGSGKTTLVRTICGVLPPLGGRLIYPAAEPRIGYVPQQARLDTVFPFTALEVVVMGLIPGMRALDSVGRSQFDRAMTHLRTLEVDQHAQQPFRDLSGGQRQRVLLARALVCEPELLVLDEPTAALDAVAEEQLYQQLNKIHQSGTTIVLINHNLARTAGLSNQLILLSRERNFVKAGNTREVMTDDVLSAIFGVTVHVEEHDCHYDLHIGNRHEHGPGHHHHH